MFISYTTLLLIHNPHAVADKPIPVRLNVIKLDVVAIITIVSVDFNIVVNVLYFLFFSIYGFYR